MTLRECYVVAPSSRLLLGWGRGYREDRVTTTKSKSGSADMRLNVPISVGGWGRFFSRWDVIAVLLVLGLLVFLAEASRHLLAPLSDLQRQPVSLDPANLPEYAARTTLRMLVAMALSLTFTFTYATLAAKNRRAERLLVPLLDILQSVPILGFISITVVFFMALAPGRVLGAEFAAIFAIFTSQAWNMAFSFYQSLRTVPTELIEASRNFRLSAWMRFWRVDVPFAMPQLIWNMMMSMSGSWFFVVASEAISVGNTTITLPGVGSYIALAIQDRNLAAVGYAIVTMLIVILIYDQLLFRPLVAWADRFRFEQEPGAVAPRSWVFDVLRRSRLVDRFTRPFAAQWRRLLLARWPERADLAKHEVRTPLRSWLGFLMAAIVTALTASALWQVARFITHDIALADVVTVLLLGLATLSRIVVLIALASVIWVPIGVWVGTRPHVANLVQPVAQFLAAFPANLLFPIAVSAIVALRLDPNIWLSPLMILGTQWYILFNVVAGASAIPAELRAVGFNFRVRGWLWWRRIALPAVLPYYVTGAITASGGSWNASIVAEVASWGNVHLEAQGLGAYIARETEAGDFHRIVLGIAAMSLFVVVINRTFWRPLYLYAERKFRLG
jgi:NitT/TauT family transport system permease protein